MASRYLDVLAVRVGQHEKHVAINGGYTSAYREIEIERVDLSGTIGPDNPTRLFVAGTVAVEICTECLLTTTTCLHHQNTWNAEGTTLSCVLCGSDGT